MNTSPIAPRLQNTDAPSKMSIWKRINTSISILLFFISLYLFKKSQTTPYYLKTGGYLSFIIFSFPRYKGSAGEGIASKIGKGKRKTEKAQPQGNLSRQGMPDFSGATLIIEESGLKMSITQHPLYRKWFISLSTV